MEKKISNNDSWSNIFEDFRILDKIATNGYFDISADEIKKCNGKEARLMTKIDHKEHLPNIMQENELSILAIKNGLYRIAKTDPFISINKEPQCEIKVVPSIFPPYISSLDPLNIKSESGALEIAYISKMLDNVFNEHTMLTVRGRLRGELNFKLNNITYEIDGVQIEVDGGYEGVNNLHLVEAKIGFRNNINIRQLLYPQLFWQNQMRQLPNNKIFKHVKSYIFYYQDDIFRFIPFKYDGKIITALHDQEKAFSFYRECNFSLSILSKARNIEVNDNVPFPQADDFEKVHAILLNIEKEDCPTKISIASDFDIVERQYDYYFNVLRWMNLCEFHDKCIYLTDRGKLVLSFNIEKRMERFATIIFSEPICYNALKGLPQNNSDFKKYSMSGSTISRRLHTIQSWIKYFNNFFEK